MDSNPPKSANSTEKLLTHSLQEHLNTISKLLESNISSIEHSAGMICRALFSGNRVFLCGNGGSAADAQHIAAELVGRYEKDRKPLPAIALTTDTSALTALSNDFGYADVFARQLKALASEGDLLIAISTSGKSESIVRAAETAREIGCATLALTGVTGQPLASKCDFAVVVPSNRTARVQEAHITIGHLWCEIVDAKLTDQQ